MAFLRLPALVLVALLGLVALGAPSSPPVAASFTLVGLVDGGRPSGGRLALNYVANLSASSVSVIDTATNAVTTTVTIGGLNLFHVAVRPDGARAYATNVASRTVAVIDTATNMIVATIPIDGIPTEVAVGP
jgi:YVTN family beta-propeller protein